MNEHYHLKNIYRLYVERSGVRSAFIEDAIEIHPHDQISLDDRRNEPDSYRVLFQGAFSPLVVELHRRLMRGLRGKPLEECEDEFAGFSFLNSAIMKSLAQYRADRASPLARFANVFDRLDEPSVRRTLYESAQLEPE